jgi:hypothetical protein
MKEDILLRYFWVCLLSLGLFLLSACTMVDSRTTVVAAAAGSTMDSADQRAVMIAALNAQPDKRFMPTIQLGGRLRIGDGMEVDNEKSFGHAMTAAVATTGLIQNGLTERAKSADNADVVKHVESEGTTRVLDGGVTERYREGQITQRMLIEP